MQPERRYAMMTGAFVALAYVAVMSFVRWHMERRLVAETSEFVRRVHDEK